MVCIAEPTTKSITSVTATPGGPPASGLGAAVTDAGALQLLLVSSTPRWTAAVHAVAAELRGTQVTTCAAKDALMEVASGERFSHLLVEDQCSDGLLDALADLTSAHALNRTSMLLLGVPANPQPGLGVIRSANRRSVRRALVPNAAPAAVVWGGIGPSDFRDVLTGTKIEARYQPIVRIADRKPVALEALARLKDPAGGTLLPDRFVPQLEGAGLARELTEIMAARVFADMTGPALAGCDLAVTLNFPLDVMMDMSALDRLDAQRQAAGVPASRVVVELTESRPAEDIVTLARSVERLRAWGYGISIDDVGPAVPRVEPLLDVPFTCLKFDKDMVRHGAEDPDALAFLRKIADAAHARNMTVVAEGVATRALWDLMASIGVDEAQGFLVARPLPAAAVPIWLDAWRRA
jgi:EAL domain-containing protein (putative c-di-GMP-specific phosphodiesterase class I)